MKVLLEYKKIKMNESFELHNQAEFELSAEITVTTDIPQHKGSESSSCTSERKSIHKINTLKHDFSLSLKAVRSKKSTEANIKTPVGRNNLPASKNKQFEFINEKINSRTTYPPKKLNILDNIQKVDSRADHLPRKLERTKKKFCERDKIHSKITDLYDEEQFMYDPESKTISHEVLTKSRSSNYGEYCNQLSNALLNYVPHRCKIPRNELKENKTLEIIQSIEIPPDKNETQNVETIAKSKSSQYVPNRSENTLVHQSPKNTNLLVVEKIIKCKQTNTEDKRIRPRPQSERETKEDSERNDVIHSGEDYNETKIIIAPCVHRRPELQKRYFYNEFKTYKIKHVNEEIPFSEHVKSAKDKFEKILESRLLHMKPCSNYTTLKKSTSSESKENIEDLKNSETFASEVNVWLNDLNTKKHINRRRNSILITNFNVNQNLHQTCHNSHQISLGKSKTHQYIELSKHKLTDKHLNVIHRTGSVDNLSRYQYHPMKINKKSSSIDFVENNCHKELKKMSANDNESRNEIKQMPQYKNENKFQNKVSDNKMKSQKEKLLQENHHTMQVPIKKDRERKDFVKNENYNSQEEKLKKSACNDEKSCYSFQRSKEAAEERNHQRERKLQDNRKMHVPTKGEKEIKDTVNENNSPEPVDNISADGGSLTSYNSDSLESFGRPISEEVLSKIRECGTSITYFGGKIISRKYGPMCSPMTMTILNEIKQYMSFLNEQMYRFKDEGRKM